MSRVSSKERKRSKMILLLISVHISDVHAPKQEVDALRHYLVYTTGSAYAFDLLQ